MSFNKRSRLGALLLLFASAGFAACAPQRLQKTEISIEAAGKIPIRVNVELARTDAERSQGLMHRKQLTDREGMLFIFERDEVLSFWMKNTLIPLSIAFISADGRIIDIKDMKPLDLSPVKSSRSVRYALEVPQGWFAREGIKTGDRLVLGDI
jgi:uncharacterized membrane protein (UPF0127 family)